MINRTVRAFQSIPPQRRVRLAAANFWLSIILGLGCTWMIADGFFERVLMAISWLAVTYTCVDIMISTDIRAEGEDK